MYSRERDGRPGFKEFFERASKENSEEIVVTLK